MNETPSRYSTLSAYFELCKPRAVALMALTAFVAMLLAVPSSTAIPWRLVLYSILGISLTAAAGASINHLIDRRIDAIMNRTKDRPIPSGRIQLPQAIILASCLTAISAVIMFTLVNKTAAILSLLTLVGYAGVYTFILKQATPQNIVIGGLAGAMPPLLGWSSMTGTIDSGALLLVAIIFTWTPPHFWALAIHRYKEYKKAGLPMMPITHGIPFTKINIVLYTLLMIIITYLAFAIHMFGWIYFIGVTMINMRFLYYVAVLYRRNNSKYALITFRFSIVYLALLFSIMVIDHYILL